MSSSSIEKLYTLGNEIFWFLGETVLITSLLNIEKHLFNQQTYAQTNRCIPRTMLVNIQ